MKIMVTQRTAFSGYMIIRKKCSGYLIDVVITDSETVCLLLSWLIVILHQIAPIGPILNSWSLTPVENLCMLVAQSCLTLCDPMDCHPPGSSIHGLLQARILEWVAISFSRGSSQGIEPWSPALQADSLPSESPEKSTVGVLSICINHTMQFHPRD